MIYYYNAQEDSGLDQNYLLFRFIFIIISVITIYKLFVSGGIFNGGFMNFLVSSSGFSDGFSGIPVKITMSLMLFNDRVHLFAEHFGAIYVHVQIGTLNK